MNKKEINEIKKNFSGADTPFVINKVVTAFVDAEKNIKCKDVKSFNLIEQDECDLLNEILKKSLSGTVGKNLLEYAFPKDAYLEGGTQPFLYEVLKSKFNNEELTDKFLNTVIEKTEYVSTYTIFSAHCTYSVFKKNKAEDLDLEADNDYNFILTAICPVELRIDGFVYDEENNSIAKKDGSDRVVQPPTDAFLFPLFNDRSADINGVLYYTKNAKKPNISIVEELLGCEFSMDCQSEKETFHKILGEVVGDKLDYDMITTVNENIQQVIDENANETEVTTIDNNKLSTILWKSGIEQTELENLPKVYEKELGDKALTAVNLVDKKTVVATSGVTVNISKDAVDKVKTQIIEGRKCLVIALDDPEITVNGLETKID